MTDAEYDLIALDLERKDSYRPGDVVRFNGRHGTLWCHRADGTGSKWGMVPGTEWYIVAKAGDPGSYLMEGYQLDDRCRPDPPDNSLGPWWLASCEGIHLEPVEGAR